MAGISATECTVCYEPMTTPVNLPCEKHFICLSCAKGWVDTDYEAREFSIRCPNCDTRKALEPDADGVRAVIEYAKTKFRKDDVKGVAEDLKIYNCADRNREWYVVLKVWPLMNAYARKNFEHPPFHLDANTTVRKIVEENLELHSAEIKFTFRSFVGLHSVFSDRLCRAFSKL